LTHGRFAANHSSGFEKVIPQHDHESKLPLLKHSVGLISHRFPPFLTISHHFPPLKLAHLRDLPRLIRASGAGTSPGLVLDHQVVQTLTQPIFFIKAQMITDAEYFATPQDSVNHRWSSHKSTANSKLPTAISSILPFNTLWHANILPI